jgi:probable addiction module antidote protein
MPTTKTSRYGVAEHLRSPEEMAAYLEACIEEANGDAAFIAKALGNIARAKGMAQVARDAGLSRESLYKALSGERSPGFTGRPITKETRTILLRAISTLRYLMFAIVLPLGPAAAATAPLMR